jgi:hypothetical protein
MPTTKLSAARSIAKALRPSEDTIDTSILSNVKLVASIIEGRLQTGVAAEVGHDAFMSATASLAALREARDHVVTCHKQLTQVRETMDLDPDGVGCTIRKLPGVTDESSVSYLPQAQIA